MKLWGRMTVGFAVLLGSTGLAGAAHASHVSCGQVITQNTVLDADVGPCPGTGLVIGAADITLDLNGHTVSGALSSTSPGILVDAPLSGASNVRVRIVNGTVMGFRIGVSVSTSVDNTIERLVVRDNLCHGIELRGIGSGGYFPAARNLVRDNVIQANGCAGVHLFQRADFNVIERNVITANAGSGVLLQPTGPNNSPRDNQVRQNSISANGLDGITERSFFNTFSGNLVRANGGSGVRIAEAFVTERSRVLGNTVTGNAVDGVVIERGRHGNEVIGNTASSNGATDLVDQNFQCDSNVWRNNSFGTRNQPCIA
jgi:parallel beta-helix repeat protein